MHSDFVPGNESVRKDSGHFIAFYMFVHNGKEDFDVGVTCEKGTTESGNISIGHTFLAFLLSSDFKFRKFFEVSVFH